MNDVKKIGIMRKLRGLTQTELAKRAGVSQSLIARIESGTVDPAYSKVEKIFFILNNEKSDYATKAEEIMTKKISTVAADKSLVSAMKIMKIKNISQMPVVQKNVVVGSVTEKAIAHAFVLNENPASLKVKDVMENPMPTIDVSTTIAVISSLLDAQSAVLVTKNGRIAGIIARSDLLKVVKKSV